VGVEKNPFLLWEGGKEKNKHEIGKIERKNRRRGSATSKIFNYYPYGEDFTSAGLSDQPLNGKAKNGEEDLSGKGTDF